MATTADFKNGLCIEYNNDIYSIVEFQHVKPGKGGAFVRTKLKSLKTGKVIDNTFNSGVKVTTARIERRPHQYLYKDDLGYHFMDAATFEQVNLPETMVTGADLLKEGTDNFTAGKLEEAEKALSAAMALRPDSYTPYYYLGLISYQRKNYARASELYTRSMELGIEPALIQYALGVNAFADKKYAEAAAYLKKAKELDPKAYGEKADSLLKRIEALK